MTDDFDGYRKWLNIIASQRPPSHYDILGVDLDEDDHEVILSAMEQRRNFVQSKRGIGHDELVSEILMRIEEAGVTLLSPEMRRDYDRQMELFNKRKKSRRVDPNFSQTPSTRFQSVPGRVVGEDGGFVKQFAGIVAILGIGFCLMAWFSFQLPLERQPKNLGTGTHVNHDPSEQGIGVPFAQSSERKRIEQTRTFSSPSTNRPSVTPSPADRGEKPLPESASDSLVMMDVTIERIDFESRTITVSYKGRTAAFGISNTATVLIDGRESDIQSLKSGQQATISFLASYNLVAKIEVLNNSTLLPVADASPTPVAEASPASSTAENLVTLEVEIVSIDIAVRSISVKRKSKTTTLEFSRKTEVIADGKSESINSLKVGQNVVVTLNAELNIVTKIEVRGADATTTADQLDSSASSAADETITVEVILTDINLETRRVSVTRKSKTSVFDLSRKTEVLIDGKRGSLASLTNGQTATITVNPELNVIIKIEITSAASTSDEK